ncbi:MAG: pyridoxal phosphate-dependent aminotransferase [Planctomycetia bacterium]|nr:pyridoxal phosphate-dependent aminotransferase [Planctomycetia bacterium]
MEKRLAGRTRLFESSGIRKVFDLGATLTDPINLSIGQPDFDVPRPGLDAASEAIYSRRNGYALTQGTPALREKLAPVIERGYGRNVLDRNSDHSLLITSGTSGGLLLALLCLVDPGDEVVMFDPFFVMYDALTKMCGGTSVVVDCYDSDFQVDVNKLEAAITPKTRAIILNSPANPSGVICDEETVKAVAELAARKNVCLISDEIYKAFCFDAPFVSPAKYNPDVLVLDGFSKSHGMPGWRIGFAHGPKDIIEQMTKFQQYTFVCAPHPFQIAATAALDADITPVIDAYRHKRDLISDGLSDLYELVKPRGAFYAFPKVPWGTAEEFVEYGIHEHKLLVIPGNVFSRRDTNFRISYAATDEMIVRGVEAMRKMAKKA